VCPIGPCGAFKYFGKFVVPMSILGLMNLAKYSLNILEVILAHRFSASWVRRRTLIAFSHCARIRERWNWQAKGFRTSKHAGEEEASS
jgi:hypothetical protein